MKTMTQDQEIDQIDGWEYGAIPGIMPNEVCYTTEEVFDALDKKLIGHYGDSFRQLANERRRQWNQKSSWNFRML